MWNKLVTKKINSVPSGINVSLEELIALRSKVVAHHMSSLKKRSNELSSGLNLSMIRGRGIEFDATREYQPGDDIRHMAWRLTARSSKPHIKIYQEEKERPVCLAIDLSPSLYFGTRRMFKSASIIRQAAFLGWSHLRMRDRIGAFIGIPQETLVFTPKAREREFLLILKSLSQYSAILPAFTENNCLHQLLMTMQQQIRTSHLIIILSDFFEFDAHIKKLISQFAERAQVKLIFVYDPLEADPPPPNQYVLTDGKKSALLNVETVKDRARYRQQFQSKLDELITFSRKNCLTLQTLRTDEELR